MKKMLLFLALIAYVYGGDTTLVRKMCVYRTRTFNGFKVFHCRTYYPSDKVDTSLDVWAGGMIVHDGEELPQLCEKSDSLWQLKAFYAPCKSTKADSGGAKVKR